MNSKTPHLCFIGNMLGKNAGYITTQGQITADLFAKDGYEITCVSSKINRATRLLEILITLAKKKRRLDVVVVEVYSGLSLITTDAVGLMCKILKLPLIMVLHGGNLPEFVEKYPRWTKRILKRADVLVAPSQFLAKKFGDHGFEVRVIPNVIELEIYPFEERSVIHPRLIWMRSFHPIYNPQMAVEVLAELRQTVPQATLTMAGVDKGLEEEIKKITGDLNLSDAVRFTGFLDGEQKIKELSHADIYLHTNLFDNMPVSVVEACALGLPVVATNVGGLPYLISNGEDGLLIESKNISAMTEAIKSLLGSPMLARKISRNARRLAEHSAWTAVKKEWVDLFDEISSNKSLCYFPPSSEKSLNVEKINLR